MRQDARFDCAAHGSVIQTIPFSIDIHNLFCGCFIKLQHLIVIKQSEPRTLQQLSFSNRSLQWQDVWTLYKIAASFLNKPIVLRSVYWNSHVIAW